MTLFQTTQMTHGHPTLFQEINIHLDHEAKVGLAGWNGTGKTTLLKIISKTIQADDGNCSWKRNIRIGYVSQFAEPEWLSQTVVDLVGNEFPDNFGEHYTQFFLSDFGFDEHNFNKKLSELSGGWVNRALLAKAMAKDPELLLLDEPTNHMDLESVLFFEEFLKNISCSFILISHDRDILDHCTNETWFIRDKKLIQIPGPYSVAKETLQLKLEAEENIRKNIQIEINRLESSARQLANWGKVYGNEKFSRRARSIENRIEKIQATQPEKREKNQNQLLLSNETLRAKSLLSIEDVEVTIANRKLFHIDKIYIRPGERLAILGENGIGKSVFIRFICSQLQLTEKEPGLRFNPNIRLGYYDQNLSDFDKDISVQEFFEDKTQKYLAHFIPALAKAGFSGQTIHQKVSTLSGGQKARLRFLLLQLMKPNFFIFDEPTNHLDIEGCEELESEILKHDLSGLFVSHDRRFLNNIATRKMRIINGKCIEE